MCGYFVHHIAFDGWFVDVLFQELQAYYAYYLHAQSNTPATLQLPALSIQYKDFALWQRSYLTGETLEDQLAYWKSQLEGYETLQFDAISNCFIDTHSPSYSLKRGYANMIVRKYYPSTIKMLI